MTIFIAEKEAFGILRGEVCYFTLNSRLKLLTVVQVNAHSSRLRRNARILDELDVALAFANLATEMKFVRPVLRDE